MTCEASRPQRPSWLKPCSTEPPLTVHMISMCVSLHLSIHAQGTVQQWHWHAHQAVSYVWHLHREEPGLCPDAVQELQTHLLLVLSAESGCESPLIPYTVVVLLLVAGMWCKTFSAGCKKKQNKKNTILLFLLVLSNQGWVLALISRFDSMQILIWFHTESARDISVCFCPNHLHHHGF